ncbi:hypothetical protein EP7_005017 [Isosphaeraceae bacterium EP7]
MRRTGWGMPLVFLATLAYGLRPGPAGFAAGQEPPNPVPAAPVAEGPEESSTDLAGEDEPGEDRLAMQAPGAPATAPVAAPALPGVAAPAAPVAPAPLAPGLAGPSASRVLGDGLTQGAPALGSRATRSNLSGLRRGRAMEMFGDKLPDPRLGRLAGQANGLPTPFPPPKPIEPGAGGQSQGVIFVPSIRGFKIADNQSPVPLDRVYYQYNYFDNVNASLNRRVNAQVSQLRVYRNILGVEKTFWDGDASIGLQLPINTLSVVSPIKAYNGYTSSFGDLAIVFKYVFLRDPNGPSLMSAGLAVTAPTGPSSFANSPAVRNLHYAGLQPYLGYFWTNESWFVQGFSSIDVPMNSADVTLMFNDFGLGYYLYQAKEESAWITTIAPTFEVHLSTPLNHRGFSLTDLAGTPDVLDFTYGLNTIIGERSRFAFGVVTPVTGPRPFSYELIAQVGIRF